MTNEQNKKGDQKDASSKLPKDVMSETQDPESVMDPLKDQLEKSEGMNTPEQQETLEKLREQDKKD